MMTEQEKQLLVKTLCGYLPYGVKILVDSEFMSEKGLDVQTLIGVDLSLMIVFAEHNWYNLEKIKPYLRPMSSMTEKEFYELCELGVSLPPFKDYYGQMQYYGSGGEWSIVDVEIEDIIKYVNYLNAHHFDFRGLIPMGLALEAPEGMYNTKTE